MEPKKWDVSRFINVFSGINGWLIEPFSSKIMHNKNERLQNSSFLAEKENQRAYGAGTEGKMRDFYAKAIYNSAIQRNSTVLRSNFLRGTHICLQSVGFGFIQCEKYSPAPDCI